MLTLLNDSSSPLLANSCFNLLTDGSSTPVSSFSSVRLSGKSSSPVEPIIIVGCGRSRIDENPESMDRLGEDILELSSSADRGDVGQETCKASTDLSIAPT